MKSKFSSITLPSDVYEDYSENTVVESYDIPDPMASIQSHTNASP